MTKEPLYVFLDEGGNFDFSPNGTRYFTLTGVTTSDPVRFIAPLSQLRYSLLGAAMDIEYFHASEDTQRTRNQVFAVIQEHVPSLWADSVIVEKRKVPPELRGDVHFYPEILGRLLQHVFESRSFDEVSQVIVITDLIPIASKRKGIMKAIQQQLPQRLSKDLAYHVYHHCSRSHFGLQVADYINWAIYRKWDRGDLRSFKLIQPAVGSEAEIFRSDSKSWY
ncbi:MAG TPA: DUF3800 domain-containing protein [Caulifigura sp.]|nr:DUF3800 domain-containing protein [Caulifigura sp.]